MAHDSLPATTDLEGVIEIFLNPGEYFVGGSGYQVRTLLGSCVSITLWHQRLRFGAISHFLLPFRKQTLRTDRAEIELDGKYADESMILILDAFQRENVPLTGCQAKIFGGGNMFPGHSVTQQLDVGLKNGEMARKLLAKYRIPVVAEDLFGYGHRELIFNLGNGDVWMRQMKLTASTC